MSPGLVKVKLHKEGIVKCMLFIPLHINHSSVHKLNIYSWICFDQINSTVASQTAPPSTSHFTTNGKQRASCVAQCEVRSKVNLI